MSIPHLPEVDVIIPVRDGLPFILEAVSSALAQTGVVTRVVVVDDGSSDGTPDAVRSLDSNRVTVLSGHPHESTCAARNRGVAASGSPWLTFLDGDDMWPAARTQRLLHSIGNARLDLAVGHVVEFSGQGPVRSAEEGPFHLPALCVGGTLSSRALFDSVGPFDERLRVGEYVDWLSRARDRGVRERLVPTVALYRRIHETNTSRKRHADYGKDVMSIVRQHQERQRGDQGSV